MFHVVLFHPEIPPNTGNVIRLCANCGASLHLVEPLGFTLEDKQLRRAGLDYHDLVPVRVHPDLAAALAALGGRHFALSSKGETLYSEIQFEPGDVFVFGPETAGLPADAMGLFPSERRLRLPMVPGNRSVNLSNSVAAVLFEAWRQQGFAGGA